MKKLYLLIDPYAPPGGYEAALVCAYDEDHARSEANEELYEDGWGELPDGVVATCIGTASDDVVIGVISTSTYTG